VHIRLSFDEQQAVVAPKQATNRDDAGHVFVWGDVKGGVEHRALIGGDSHTANHSDFFGIPLLNVDAVARCNRQING
jgi:hypothetical protein